jgi:hypothetical protein
MAFSARRGRPRKDISEKNRDRGTPELQRKRALSHTSEAIDFLLQRGVISEQEHWCGLHYRWLYTLRYGAPSVQSLDPNHSKGFSHSPIRWDWQEAREAEWVEAQQKLQQWGSLRAVRDVTLYNHLAPSLMENLRQGLRLLVTQWCKNSADE